MHFSQPLVGFWGFAPYSHRGSISGPRWGNFVPRHLLCPPLEKILPAPMTVTTNAIIYHVISLQQLDNETELITLKRAEEWPQYATQQWSNMQFVDREKWPIKRQTDYCTTTNNERATGIIAQYNETSCIAAIPIHLCFRQRCNDKPKSKCNPNPITNVKPKSPRRDAVSQNSMFQPASGPMQ